jgi:predicted cobalt transporter CbtA
MVRELLIRGMFAGLVAGLLAFGIAKVFGEPQVDRAIAFEEQHAKAEAAEQHHDQSAADQQEMGADQGDNHAGEREELISRKVVIAQLVLPDINEVPAEFPATVLWKFRMASLGLQALMWTTLGLLFGALAERVVVGRYESFRPLHSPSTGA